MSIQQLHLFNALYLAVLVVVAVLTRAPPRRIAGAVTGAAVAAALAIAIIALGEAASLWRMAITWKPYYLALLWLDFTLGAFIFLLTWRVARRFGWRGLAVVLLVAAILGPLRDYRYMERFPEWGEYSPGFAPVLAVSVTYVVLGCVGHGVMRLIAGPAREDQLVRRWWKAA